MIKNVNNLTNNINTGTACEDLEPGIHARPAPTTRVLYEDFCEVARGVRVPVVISFEFRKVDGQRLAPRLCITINRRVDTEHLSKSHPPLSSETMAEINSTIHYNNISCIRLHDDAEGQRYTFEFIGESQAQSYYAPDWAGWRWEIFALKRNLYTEELGMNFKHTPRTEKSEATIEFTYDSIV
jgi:hypothetical protein